MLIALGGAQRLIKKLLTILQTLDAAEELPSYHGTSSDSLSKDLYHLCGQLLERLDSEAAAVVLKYAVTQPVDDELLWSAVYKLVHEVSSHPTTPPRKQSYSTASWDSFRQDLVNDWNREFFDDALIGLRQQMRDCLDNEVPYYAKTLVFVQSSGMGKSRLADFYGQICPMISFVLRNESD